MEQWQGVISAKEVARLYNDLTGQWLLLELIKVDEKGTEAAAATAVVMGETSAGLMDRKIFKADHPFIFIIQEKNSGNILFMGRVVDPR